jgi:hypothetical protein
MSFVADLRHIFLHLPVSVLERKPDGGVDYIAADPDRRRPRCGRDDHLLFSHTLAPYSLRSQVSPCPSARLAGGMLASSHRWPWRWRAPWSLVSTDICKIARDLAKYRILPGSHTSRKNREISRWKKMAELTGSLTVLLICGHVLAITESAKFPAEKVCNSGIGRCAGLPIFLFHRFYLIRREGLMYLLDLRYQRTLWPCGYY